MSDNRKIALAFMAHPDDAEILCAGTLIRLHEIGYEVHIATVAAGDCGSMTLEPDEIMKTRLAEAKAASALISATYHCLDERDGFVVYDKPTIRKAVELFRAIGPSIVFTHPLLDYMVDHEQVAMLARGASFLYCAPNASTTPIRPGSSVPHLYYCDPIEGIDLNGGRAGFTTLVDISSVMETKRAMLAAHASQRDWLRAHHGMDEYVEAMKRHGETRGAETGVKYAEAFAQHRGHGYPHDDLLSEFL